MVKAVTFFLIAIIILAIFGKLRFPGQARLASRKCPRCGRFRIGRGPCDCTKSRRG